MTKPFVGVLLNSTDLLRSVQVEYSCLKGHVRPESVPQEAPYCPWCARRVYWREVREPTAGLRKVSAKFGLTPEAMVTLLESGPVAKLNRVQILKDLAGNRYLGRWLEMSAADLSVVIREVRQVLRKLDVNGRDPGVQIL